MKIRLYADWQHITVYEPNSHKNIVNFNKSKFNHRLTKVIQFRYMISNIIGNLNYDWTNITMDIDPDILSRYFTNVSYYKQILPLKQIVDLVE